MTTSFLLIRHAESEWNAAGRWQGHADPPLSPRGREQARALARRLASEPSPDRLVCSDLERARATAEEVAAVLGVQPELWPALRELDVGTWSGLTRGEIEATDARVLARFEAGDDRVRAGGGESRSEIRRRVQAAFRELARLHPEGRVLAVTHLGVIRALIPGAEPGHTERMRLTL